MLAQFGLGDSPAVHYAIAFAIIFVLLTLFALVLRRLTGGRSMLSGPGAAPASHGSASSTCTISTGSAS